MLPEVILKIARAVVAVACVLLIPSCGHSHGIIGKWRTSADTGEMVWEFHEDGSVTQGTVRGRYRFGDDERVKIETPFAISVYRMELSGDRLTLTDTSGRKIDFARVKDETR